MLLGGAACLAESYVDGKYMVFGGAHWCLKISPPVFHLESIVFFIKIGNCLQWLCDSPGSASQKRETGNQVARIFNKLREIFWGL